MTHPQTRATALAEVTQHWGVTVSRNGDQIVTIESNHLAGREISEEDKRTIECAAHHLLSFIGAPIIARELAAQSSDNPVPDAVLGMAQQAGSWFDRKDLSLDQREWEVAKLIMSFIVKEMRQRENAAQAWRPISEAPRDGTRILAFFDDQVWLAHWYVHAAVQGWITPEMDCTDYDFDPTHWQSLPSPPEQKGEE